MMIKLLVIHWIYTILPIEVRMREFLLDINTYGNIYICQGALNKIIF